MKTFKTDPFFLTKEVFITLLFFIAIMVYFSSIYSFEYEKIKALAISLGITGAIAYVLIVIGAFTVSGLEPGLVGVVVLISVIIFFLFTPIIIAINANEFVPGIGFTLASVFVGMGTTQKYDKDERIVVWLNNNQKNKYTKP